MAENRVLITEFVLHPATAKAIILRRGQILHIEQLGNGQCSDFNAFNLHDYKEHYHSLRTLQMETAFPTVGNKLWSNPPRERPMLTIITDTVGTNDVLAARCSAFINEFLFGIEYHTNCADNLAEAIREYGLTPDDVHDSFNGFMDTGLDEKGRFYVKPQRAKKGDYLELIAHFEILAVPASCGMSISATNNYELKPLRIQIIEASDEEKAKWLEPEERVFRNQRTPSDFVNSKIKADRELIADPSYKQVFRNDLLTIEEIEVDLDSKEYALIDQVRKNSAVFGTDAEILRTAFFEWLQKNFLMRDGKSGQVLDYERR